MRARDDSALTEVGCCPQTAAACKTAPGQDCNRGPDEHEPTVDDRDSGRTGRDSRPSSAFQKVARTGIISASSLATGTGQRATYGQGLQNANMPKPTHGREKVRSQVEAHAKTAQPVASVMPVGS